LANDLLYEANYFKGYNKNYHEGISYAILAGVVAVAIPLDISIGKSEWKAVRQYNSDQKKTAHIEHKPELYFTLTGIGAGIGIQF
jgi:hypothetical protein